MTTSADRPLVSVVLPTYGRRVDHLVAAVESVTAQTYDRIELIVVDDSPGAVSIRIEDQYEDGVESLRCLRDGETEGPAAARNRGIRAATGEYVAFLDDDDRWLPEKVERQVRTFESAPPRVGVVYTGSRRVADGRTLRVETPTVGGCVLTNIFDGDSLGPFSTVMVEMSAVEDAGYIDERLRFLEDREWYLRLAKHYEFRPVPEPLVLRRTGDYEQLSDDYETLKNVTYSTFIRKHRSLAAKHGKKYERRLVGTLSKTVSNAALNAGRYSEARGFALRALRHYPSDWVVLGYLVAALGGRWTHRAMQRLNRALGRLPST